MRKAVMTGAAGLCLAGAALVMAGETAIPKAYVVGEIAVTNPDGYAQYVAKVGPVIAACGGRYLVRGGASEAREGEAAAGRMVVIEFASLAAARACLDGPEYKAVAHLRHANARSRILLVEGVAP
ncbi:DUF1330 domain-containing protein [Erythrobacter sp. W302b]|uniref:DUF1330 domain-containing protein n=1 Tax=Erythrobacter sp. W302b TaxID=3389874 RepID=UPI00396B3ACB